MNVGIIRYPGTNCDFNSKRYLDVEMERYAERNYQRMFKEFREHKFI